MDKITERLQKLISERAEFIKNAEKQILIYNVRIDEIQEILKLEEVKDESNTEGE